MSATEPIDQPGAPNDADDPQPAGWWAAVGGFWSRRKRWILVGVAVLVVTAIAVPVARVWIAWGNVERVAFDPDAARIAIENQTLAVGPVTDTTFPADAPDPTTPTVTVPPPPDIPFDGALDDGDHTAVLIIGSDLGGYRADVIMLALIPSNGSNLALVSIPRDLYLDDPCGGGRERINAALNGCGEVTGPNLLAIAVEDFTGVPVDYFVLFDFDGFSRVIDAVGGVEICVDHDTYDRKTDPELALLAGCHEVGGKMALSWVRSRHTREVVDGVTRTMPGVNDLARNARQRAIVLQLLGRLSSFPNPAELVGLVEAVPGAFTLSDGLSLTTAIGIAWDLRGTPMESVLTPEIPVTFYKASTGAQVLLPVESFSDTMGWDEQ
ncbi:MAG: LCP family protein [Actinomycetota bacterium]